MKKLYTIYGCQVFFEQRVLLNIKDYNPELLIISFHHFCKVSYNLYEFYGFAHNCKKVTFAYAICFDPTPSKINKILTLFIKKYGNGLQSLIYSYIFKNMKMMEDGAALFKR